MGRFLQDILPVGRYRTMLPAQLKHLVGYTPGDFLNRFSLV